jgi:hypothetical protein
MEFTQEVKDESSAKGQEKKQQKTATVIQDSAAINDDDENSVTEEDPQASSPPAERLVYPKDVVDFNDEDEIIYVLGTRGGKVTRISGLENMSRIKVN